MLALVETHLADEESLADWEKEVEGHGGYNWSGRPAVRRRGDEGGRGRGSGGIGILVGRRWSAYTTVLPSCDSDCIHFVRLQLPDAPFIMSFGALYLAPPGSARFASRDAVLDELENRVEELQAQGLVCVMGDCNVHIAECPSTLRRGEMQLGRAMTESAPVQNGDISGRRLCRTSVDTRGADKADGVSAAGRAFVERMDAAGLVVLNGLVDAGDGAQATATRGESSVLDLVMVDSAHWSLLDSVGVDVDLSAEVASDHSPVRSVIRYVSSHNGAAARVSSTQLPAKVALTVSRVRYLAQSRGDPHHFEEFEQECTRRLGSLADHWERTKGTVAANIENAWAEFLAVVQEAARVTVGTRPVRHSALPRAVLMQANRRAVHRPGDAWLREWKRERRRLRRVREGVAAADPERARLDLQLRSLDTRIKNHVRKAVREQRQQEVDNVRALAPHQWREHWRALRKMGHLSSGAAPGAAETVLNAAGEAEDGPDAVRRGWLEFWAGLAREAPADDGRFDASSQRAMREQLAEAERADLAEEWPRPLTAAQADAEITLNPVPTLTEVQSSVKRLLNAKAPGCDGVVSEVLKNGGEQMIRALHALCRAAWTSGSVPLDWMRGVVVPLFKDGDRRAPGNYRPITLLSIVAKVYTGVLQARLLSWSERHGVIEQEQGGFRPGRGCPEQLFTLTELVKVRRLRGQRTYACFLDIRKAYDTVWHDGLRLRLLQCGVRGAMYRAICSLYAACESCMRLGGEAGYTDFFPVETGVRQGCILSPLLYSIFINGLAVALKQRGLGARIDVAGSFLLCVLLYADDIALLAESEEEMQQLLDVVAEYARRWRFEINHSKCGAVRFNRKGAEVPSSALLLGGVPIPWVRSYKYLGVELCGSPGRPFHSFRCRMLSAAQSAAGQIAAMGMHSGKLPVPLGVQVYQALVRPLLEYAAEVVSVQPWPAAERVQSRVAKRILQCPWRASTVACRGELGWMTLEGRWQQLRVSFWGRLQRMDNDRPARRVYDESLAEFHRRAAEIEGVPSVRAEGGWSVQRPHSPAGTAANLWCAQLQRDLYTLGLADCWERPVELVAAVEQSVWKSRCHKAVEMREAAHWAAEVQARPPLQRVYALLKTPSQSGALRREAYLEIPHGGWNDRIRVGRCAVTQLRTASSRLRIVTGAWSGLDEARRHCRMCGDGVEDEAHLLLRCGAFAADRVQLAWRINAWVQQAESAQPDAPGAHARAFDMLLEPEPQQLQILLGGRHPRVAAAGPGVAMAVMREALIHVGRWMRAHQMHLLRLQEIEAP